MPQCRTRTSVVYLFSVNVIYSLSFLRVFVHPLFVFKVEISSQDYQYWNENGTALCLESSLCRFLQKPAGFILREEIQPNTQRSVGILEQGLRSAAKKERSSKRPSSFIREAATQGSKSRMYRFKLRLRGQEMDQHRQPHA